MYARLCFNLILLNFSGTKLFTTNFSVTWFKMCLPKQDLKKCAWKQSFQLPQIVEFWALAHFYQEKCLLFSETKTTHTIVQDIGEVLLVYSLIADQH